MYAPWCVLYGVLSFANRTSLYGRNTFAVPNSGSSSPRSAFIGAATASSYVARCASQNDLVLSISRSS